MRERDDLLKFAALVAVFLLLLAFAIGRIRRLEEKVLELRNAPADTVLVTRIDTILREKPTPVYKYISRTEFVEIPGNSVRIDTVKELVFLPREVMVYKDSTYRAVVSGVQPRLDSIEIYRPTITQTVTKTVSVPDRRRWGVGVQVGAGWNGKEVQPYLGVGVQYSIVRW